MSRSIAISGVAKISGEISLPGDKSISHRVAILSSLARGASTVSGFASSRDCQSTLDCLRKLGVEINRRSGRLVIEGKGPHGFSPREDPAQLDAGNSGSTIRMLSGILAAQPFSSIIDGDASLRSRPMRRVIEPLRLMGARIESDGRPPLRIAGTDLRAIDYSGQVASAQVKSCVLLAGLLANGTTTYREPSLSRDHTEIMLREFRASIAREETGAVSVQGGVELEPVEYAVPGDPSSAAFFIAAAAMLPGSELVVRGICLNPTRIAYLDVMRRLGARVSVLSETLRHGEIVGDLVVTHSCSQVNSSPVSIGGPEVPGVIDELPILAVLAAAGEGELVVRDAEELRVKESDRIRYVVQGIRSMGGRVEEFEDGFAVAGGGKGLRPARVATGGDHRIAMAFSIAALAARGESVMDDGECAGVSFPEFFDLLKSATAQGPQAGP